MFKTGYFITNFYSDLPAHAGAGFIAVTDLTMFGLTGSALQEGPSALNMTVMQVKGDTLRSTYCPSPQQPSPGAPIFRQSMPSTLKMEGDH